MKIYFRIAAAVAALMLLPFAGSASADGGRGYERGGGYHHESRGGFDARFSTREYHRDWRQNDAWQGQRNNYGRYHDNRRGDYRNGFPGNRRNNLDIIVAFPNEHFGDTRRDPRFDTRDRPINREFHKGMDDRLFMEMMLRQMRKQIR